MDIVHTFTEGDIVYSTGTDGVYIISKILKTERRDDGEIWHELLYKPVKSVPKMSEIQNLPVSIYHVPRARPNELPTFLGNLPVTEDDLEGYNEYLRQTQL